MILFVRAVNGQVDHIELVHYGVTFSPVEVTPGKYLTPFGSFDVSVLENDAVWVVPDQDTMIDWSKVNDLYRFIFPDVGEEPEPEGGTVGVSVSEVIRTADGLR